MVKVDRLVGTNSNNHKCARDNIDELNVAGFGGIVINTIKIAYCVHFIL